MRITARHSDNITANTNNDSEKIWCLPFNGDIDFALNFASDNNQFIYEFYGDDGFFSSSRHSQNIPCEDLSRLVSGLGKLNVKFNYTLNSLNLEAYLAQKKALILHL